jgi:hypothetical protein
MPNGDNDSVLNTIIERTTKTSLAIIQKYTAYPPQCGIIYTQNNLSGSNTAINLFRIDLNSIYARPQLKPRG